ncbi:MAG TPA: NapC/NirT family cytochrome c [Candidatus Angelobacter sp.]|nr:NapC/NirT family cytochrome c [Candidatus Angelobacter sp.]
MPTVAVFAVLVITVLIAGLVIARPAITVAREGKALAFLGLFIFPVVTAFLGVDNHVERSKETSFCLSCHVMGPYGKSLYVDDPAYVPASHFQNHRVPPNQACYTCHTDYTLYTGSIKAKIRGLHHIYAQYIGTVHQPIQLYHPFNNRECLHCHLGARNFEQGTTHNAIMDDIKSNQLSCVTSGCHDMIHNVSHLDQVKMWSPKP